MSLFRLVYASTSLLSDKPDLAREQIEQILEFIAKGWLGRPLFAKGTSAGWLSFRPWDFRLSREQTGGGCWVDAGGHLVYCLRAIFGEVESVKTTSDIYCGVSGEISETNAALSDDPGLLNKDPYGKGWLVKVKITDKSGLSKLMDAKTYDSKH